MPADIALVCGGSVRPTARGLTIRCCAAQSLKSRIDKLKRKHGEQMEQLALRQKQEMFIANAQSRASGHRGTGGTLGALDTGRRALGDTPR